MSPLLTRILLLAAIVTVIKLPADNQLTIKSAHTRGTILGIILGTALGLAAAPHLP